ncbi:glutamate--tRNA ligase, partial [Candidatus Saccharibacteria bacterium]|nr:glutamate--tRNA ligase [Candidatus Saccharibacteria bacterium]
AGPEVQDDIILIKKDGLPTYNFAHIVDDTLMNINMVARGVEYLSSTPNYLALYEALDVKKPLFVSLPHILAPQGNKKLSKRDGAKSVTEYRADGILPEAMLNYLACLGWNDGTEQEIYTKDELIERFSVSRIQNSGARFDETKLLWMNGQWIRKLVDEEGIDKFFPRTLDFWPDSAKSYDDDYKKRVLAIIYDRLKTLSDLREMTDYFFTDPKINVDLLTSNRFLKKLSEAELESLLETTISSLETISEDSWNEETLKNTLNSLLEATNKKPAELFSLIRISVSFAPFSPALDLTLSVLGRTTTLSRLRAVKSALLLDGE